MNCDRCKKPANIVSMSWFNTDILCMVCKENESSHPDCDYAREKEEEAVKGGDYCFPGVGWPGGNGRLQR